MDIWETAETLRAFFLTLPEVKNAALQGSLQRNSHDEYSDIDIELDVSGSDNGAFFLRIPMLLNQIYPVIFHDYAPSLLPDSYIVSCAISEENPFLIVDIKCSAVPHIQSIQKGDLAYEKFPHILKLWIVNLKHYLRGCTCIHDIERMYHKLFSHTQESEAQMLLDVFNWLKENQTAKYAKYLQSCERYLFSVPS